MFRVSLLIVILLSFNAFAIRPPSVVPRWGERLFEIFTQWPLAGRIHRDNLVYKAGKWNPQNHGEGLVINALETERSLPSLLRFLDTLITQYGPHLSDRTLLAIEERLMGVIEGLVDPTSTRLVSSYNDWEEVDVVGVREIADRVQEIRGRRASLGTVQVATGHRTIGEVVVQNIENLWRPQKESMLDLLESDFAHIGPGEEVIQFYLQNYSPSRAHVLRLIEVLLEEIHLPGEFELRKSLLIDFRLRLNLIQQRRRAVSELAERGIRASDESILDEAEMARVSRLSAHLDDLLGEIK